MNAEQLRILDRIRKLLRLGRSSHKAEAEAAIAKAHELAQEAGIAIEGVDADQEATRITHERGSLKARTHSRLRCHNILKRHFSVWIIGSGDGVLYVGPAVNIAIAQHVEAYLIRECSTARTAHAKANKIRKPRTSSERRKVFELMFYHGIDEVLNKRPVRNDRDEIMQAVERYARDNFDIRSQSSQPPKRCNALDYLGGLHSGRSTRIDRPVSDAAKATELAGGRKELTA